MKSRLLAVVAVFVLWQVMDFVIHGVLLGSTYEATLEMWRPEAEMKMGLMMVVLLIAAVAFVLIYGLLGQKGLSTGIKFGLLFGIGTGIGMGFGTYAVMPIPSSLAWGWFFAQIAEAVAAGIVTAAIVKS